MTTITTTELAKVNSFPKLVDLLRERLEWPIKDDYGFDDIVYEYDTKELGFKPGEIAKIREIHQLRPLKTNQPWGIFFISFEEKSISVTVLRRMLRALVVNKRGDAKTPDKQGWQKHDLIFVANFGKSQERELAFAHFSDGEATNDLPVLNVIGWNAKDTKLHNDYVANILDTRLNWPDDTADIKAWRANWASAFELKLGEVARTSKDLATRLATLASNIRRRANELLDVESDLGPMRSMLAAFRKNLIQDLDEDGFADMFAQTVSYGMLAAKISRPGADLVADNLADMVPKTNPFLKELFTTFLSLGGRDTRKAMDFDELGVRDVVDMLNHANMDAVLMDFGDRNPKEDPVIHFYELFLKEYDPAKRMQRGVFYTPRPVVNFIVRGVDEILRTEFGLPLGLADTTTWGELAARNEAITIPSHVKPETPFVQILDPATGTGTFLVEVIDLIHKRMSEHWKAQDKNEAEIIFAWNAYVPQHLLPRLNAFELMMAPYAIAHMKVGLKLKETGYTFGSNERARIFLTNALEPARDLDMEFVFMSEALAHEAQASNDAKAKAQFTVLVGNPPYSRESKNMTETQRELVQHLKIIDGVSIVKRGHLELERAIQNDYVKFISLSQRYVSRNGAGLIGLITSNSFLEASLLSGLRYYSLRDFELSIVDLHGYSQGQANDADGDENVFDILEGVAVHFSRHFKGQNANIVYLANIRGSREEKFDRLLSSGVLASVKVEAKAPSYLFTKPSESLHEVYGGWTYLENIMPLVRGAIVTARDSFVIGKTAAELEDRLSDFRDSRDPLEDKSTRLGARWSGSWANEGKAVSAQASIRSMQQHQISSAIARIAYRPFDFRFLFYVDDFLDTPARAVMGSMLQTHALGLSLGKSTRNPSIEHFLAVDKPVEAKCTESTKQCHLAPLWLKPSAGETHRRPNIDRNYAQQFGVALGLAYEDGIPRGEQASLGADFRFEKPEQLSLDKALWDGRGDLAKSFGPRDLFDWIYAVLHAPSYRNRYGEFLKSDFPRIPTPKDRTTFAALLPLGRELVALHLLKPEEAPVLKTPEIRFAGNGEARVAKGYPDYVNGKVMINANRWFEDVPKATWEFHVGGYQVCQKWLKDRAEKDGKKPTPGRLLTEEDILHYRRVVTALTETRRLMAEIDTVIEDHGGWPGAFASGETVQT